MDTDSEEIKRTSLESEEYIRALNILLLAELGEMP